MLNCDEANYEQLRPLGIVRVFLVESDSEQVRNAGVELTQIAA